MNVIEMAGAAVVLVVSVIGGVTMVDARYETKASAQLNKEIYQTRTAAKLDEDRALQIHTQLIMMLMEERVRRYSGIVVPEEASADMQRIKTQITALDGLFRKELLTQGARLDPQTARTTQ